MIGQAHTSILVAGATETSGCVDDLSTPCDTPPRYLNSAQIAELLSERLTPNTCADIQKADLPSPIRHNGHQFWCEEEVQEFLKSRRDQN